MPAVVSYGIIVLADDEVEPQKIKFPNITMFFYICVCVREKERENYPNERGKSINEMTSRMDPIPSDRIRSCENTPSDTDNLLINHSSKINLRAV